jgi:hypothetical protein
MRWWLVGGLAIGAAMASKFTGVFVPIALLLAFVLHAPLRARFREPGPWIAVVVASAVMAPVLLVERAARLDRVPLPARAWARHQRQGEPAPARAESRRVAVRARHAHPVRAGDRRDPCGTCARRARRPASRSRSSRPSAPCSSCTAPRAATWRPTGPRSRGSPRSCCSGHRAPASAPPGSGAASGSPADSRACSCSSTWSSPSSRCPRGATRCRRRMDGTGSRSRWTRRVARSRCLDGSDAAGRGQSVSGRGAALVPHAGHAGGHRTQPRRPPQSVRPLGRATPTARRRAPTCCSCSRCRARRERPRGPSGA